MITVSQVANRAEKLASENGGFWYEHVDRANRELAREHDAANATALRKLGAPNDELRQRVIDIQFRRTFGKARRVEIGEVDAESLGSRVLVSYDSSDGGSISVHGVQTALDSLGDLQHLFVASAAALMDAENQQAQATARTTIGLIVDAALRRDRHLSAKVKQQINRVRYGV